MTVFSGQWLVVRKNTFVLLFIFVSLLSVTSVFAQELLLKGHKGPVTSIDFSDCSRFLVSGSSDGNIILWRMKTGEKILTLYESKYIEDVVISRNGKYIASVGQSNALKIWNFKTGKLLKSYTPTKSFSKKAVEDAMFSASFSKDNAFVVASTYEYIYVLRLSDFKMVKKIKIPGEWIRSVDFSGDGKRLLAAGRDSVFTWDLVVSGLFKELLGMSTFDVENMQRHIHGDHIYSSSFSLDGSTFCAAGERGFLSFWRSEDNVLLWANAPHKGRIWGSSFSPDGQYLVTSGNDNIVNILSTKNGEIPASRGELSEIYDVDISNNQKMMATGMKNGTIKVVDFPYKMSLVPMIKKYAIYIGIASIFLLILGGYLFVSKRKKK